MSVDTNIQAGQPIKVEAAPNDKPLNFNFTFNAQQQQQQSSTPPPQPDWLSATIYVAAETFLQAALFYNQRAAYTVGALGGMLGKSLVNKNVDALTDIPSRLNSGAVAFSKENKTIKTANLAMKIGLTYASTAVYFQSFGPLYAAYRGQALFGDLNAKDVKKLAS